MCSPVTAHTFVAAGELLVDFISRQPSTPLAISASFGKFFGGSPANVAVNMKNLGIDATLISKVGRDGLGDFLVTTLEGLGIDTRFVSRHSTVPTSMVVLTAGQSPVEFIAYRSADTQLEQGDIPGALLDGCTVFHTTAHGIARNPTRDTILEAFTHASHRGKMTSFDPNYSSSYWPDREEAMEVISRFLSCATFCKPSLDDCERLLGPRGEGEYLEALHRMGVKHIMLTRGRDGAVFSSFDGTRETYPAREVPCMVDPTGAGDAFTAGFFAALLRTGNFQRAMETGIRTAAISIQHLGALAPLPKVEELL